MKYHLSETKQKAASPIITIPTKIYDQIKSDHASKTPLEACGLLAGHKTSDHFQVENFFPMHNVLKCSTAYRLDPKELVQFFNTIESLNMELVAISHSHPRGKPYPSPADILESYYPDTVYLIWAPVHQEWHCRAYFIQDKNIKEVIIKLGN